MKKQDRKELIKKKKLIEHQKMYYSILNEQNSTKLYQKIVRVFTIIWSTMNIF